MISNKVIKNMLLFFIICTSIIPLLVFSSAFIFPFIFPKIVIFRSLVIVMLGCYILLTYTKSIVYTWNVLDSAVVLFFVSLMVSTFLGVDWYKSFWDNHERMLGLFTMIHYVLYYFILKNVIREKKDWHIILRSFLIVGSIVVLIGVLQRFVNTDLLYNKGAERVSSTLGNAIYFSGYGLFIGVIGLYLSIQERYTRKIWFWISVIASCLGFFAIFLGGTRGTLVGLVVAISIASLLYIFYSKDNKKLRRFIIVIICFFCVLLGILYIFRKSSFVTSIPGLDRLVSTSFISGTGETRLMAWDIAVDAWREKPFFGWGPNNYYYAFNKYYNPKFLEYGWGETWFDNAHSVIFNTLAVQGLVGLLSYIGLFILPIICVYQLFNKKQIDIHTFVLLIAFYVGHFFHNIFVFENPTSYLYFFLILAFISSQYNVSSLDKYDHGKKIKNVSVIVAVMVCAVCVLFVYATDINPARANMLTFNNLKEISLAQVDPTKVLKNLDTYPSPHIDDIRNDISRVSAQVLEVYANKNQVEKSVELLKEISQNLYKNITLHPYDVRVYIQLSQYIIPVADETKSITLLQESEHLLEQALTFSPARQQIQYMLAQIKMKLGKDDEALSLLQRSIDNDPYISEGWWRLAFFKYSKGDVVGARQLLLGAEAQGVTFNDEQSRVIYNLIFKDQ